MIAPTPGARARYAHKLRMLAFAAAHERGEIMPAVEQSIEAIRSAHNVVVLSDMPRIERKG